MVTVPATTATASAAAAAVMTTTTVLLLADQVDSADLEVPEVLAVLVAREVQVVLLLAREDGRRDESCLEGRRFGFETYS